MSNNMLKPIISLLHTTLFLRPRPVSNGMKRKFTQCLLVALATLYPILSRAQAPIWSGNRCEGDTCTWAHLMGLLRDVINFLIIIALPISAIVFAFGGFKILTSGENAGARSEAKRMMGKVAIGLVLMLSAGLIVNTIIGALQVKDDYVLIETTQ